MQATALTEGDDGLYSGPFALPAGDYEGKVALDGAWTDNYGVDGAPDGDNYPFTLAADGEVTFTYDPESSCLEIGYRVIGLCNKRRPGKPRPSFYQQD